MISSAGDPNYKHLYFNWNLVDWCNYSCSYCSAAEMMRETFDKVDSHSKYKLVLKRLEQVDTTFEVWLLGGEPTLHDHFLEIIDSLVAIENCTLVTVFTNLSRPYHFYNKIRHPKVCITASFHPEFYKDTFLEKCIALNDENFVCSVNISDRKEDWEVTDNLLKELNEYGVNYGPTRLFSTPAREIIYTDEGHEKYGKEFERVQQGVTYPLVNDNRLTTHLTAYEIYKQGLDNFKGYMCDALMYTIDVTGEISNMCNGQKPNILLKYDKLDKVVCPHNSCQCEEMFNFYKEKV